MLLTHMKEGLSYDCFAGVIEVNPDTLYQWEKDYPEFSETKKRAFALCRLWWEKEGKQGLWSESFGQGQGSKSMNATMWIFNMKNRFRKDWADRHEIVKDVNDLDDDEFNALAAKVVERIKGNKE